MQLQLQYYEKLLRRAIVDQQQLAVLHSKYHTLLSGVTGEKRVLFELKELQLPHYFIHNFTTKNQFGHTVQIDIIFVCTQFVMILEVKNISGRIDFDDQRRQLIRTRLDGQQESFMNPVDQVKRHQQYMESLLVTSAEYIPVESAVVIANPSTIIGRISSEVAIFNVSGLRSKITELVKKYADVSLNMRRVRDFIKSEAHEPTFPKLDYPIREGVLCLTCGEVMVLSKRGFKCYKCNCWDSSHEALKRSLSDYKMLCGNEITNVAFRRFMRVRSSRTAHKYLVELKLPHKGEHRGRVYLLDDY